MKVVNSRGRVLLHVTDARIVDRGNGPEVFYSYKGDGCGGYGPRDAVDAKVRTIQADAPSARVTGTLPEVQS